MTRAEKGGRGDGFEASDEGGFDGADAVDAPQVGGEGDGGTEDDGDDHGEDDVGRPRDREAPHASDEANAEPGDQQGVSDDDVGAVGRDESRGKQRVGRQRERSDGAPGEGGRRDDEGVQRPVCAQQEGAAHREDDGDGFAGSGPPPVRQAHPDDDEDESQVFQDGSRPRVRGADDTHVGDLAGRQAENRVDRQVSPVAWCTHQIAMLGRDPARAGENAGEGKKATDRHAQEADESELDAVAAHEVLSGDTGGAPA